MGGVFGHMSHLYDNPNLTFTQIKDVFQKASRGALMGTEKTDGQNLFVSYDLRDGTVRAARNKGNIKAGGLTPEELGAKFAGRGPLSETFVDAFDAFALAVAAMPDDLKLQIFGPEANIYYNAEVQDPRSANIINYDVKTFNIHRTGHAEYDKETGKAIRDASENAGILEQYLQSAENSLEGTEYRVQVNAVRQLEKLTNDAALDEALARLEKFTSSHGLSDNNTIGEYLVARLDAYLNSKLKGLNIEAKKLLMKRMLEEGYGVKESEGAKPRKVTQRQIIQALDNPENADTVKYIIKIAKDVLKEFIYPLEDIIHDFSVEMLKGLQSAFVLDNQAEVERQKQEVATAIQAIENSNNEEAMEILRQQMRKLKNVDNVSTAAEGFVFDYDGQTYKFTGNFAPVNQILGLFKYGRGGVPPLRPLTAAEVLNEQVVNKGSSFLFIPGGFKPPHKGHLHLLETAVRNLPGAKPYLVTGETPRDGITLRQAMQVWKIYLQNTSGLDLDELSIITVPKGGLPVLGADGAAMKNQDGKIRISNSPLQAIYNAGVGLPKGAELYIVSSEADPDHASIGKAIQKNRPDLEVKAFQVPTLNDPETGGKLSARDIRDAISQGDFERFQKFLPNNEKIRRMAEYIFTTILKGKIKQQDEYSEEEVPVAESFRSSHIPRLSQNVDQITDSLADLILEAINEEQPPTLSTPLGPMALSYEPGDLELLRKAGQENLGAYRDLGRKIKGKISGRDWKPGKVTAQPTTVKEQEIHYSTYSDTGTRYISPEERQAWAKDSKAQRAKTAQAKTWQGKTEPELKRVSTKQPAKKVAKKAAQRPPTDLKPWQGETKHSLRRYDPKKAAKKVAKKAAQRGAAGYVAGAASRAVPVAAAGLGGYELGKAGMELAVPHDSGLRKSTGEVYGATDLGLATGEKYQGSEEGDTSTFRANPEKKKRNPYKSDEWNRQQGRIEEMSSMAAGDVEGGMIGTGSKKGPWHDFDAEAFNKRQKADSTLKDKEALIGEIIDYLLGREV